MISPNELFSVKDRFAVVTGGTRGIGYDLAEALVAGGATVVVSSRKAEACETSAAALSKLGTVYGFPADLSSLEGIQALKDFVAEKTDKVDILVNNAGAAWGSTLSDFPESGWDKVMDINLKSPFFLTQAFFPLIKHAASADQPAKIINIASVEGIRPAKMETYSYGASKSGLIHLTKHLADQLAAMNICVNAIAPGPFATKMLQGTIDAFGEEAMSSQVPLGRLGKSEDLYALGLYLASSASDYVTGQTIAIGGGMGTIA